MEIEQQFLGLLKIVEDLQKKVIRLEKENQLLIQGQKQLIEWSELNQKDNLYFQENIEYELRDAMRDPASDFLPHICSGEIAVEKIIHERKSLARFGDGEFSAIAGRTRHKFQTQIDDGLKKRLLEVLQKEYEELLIGIADNYGSLRKYNAQAKREIRCYLNPAVRREHLCLLDPERIYYDAYVTRPYVMYADNQTDAPAKRFQNLKRIWNKRDCIFVEGQFTGLGVGNDLFDNAASVKRILGPAENAFTRYPEILECCLAQNKDDLFLLALGPTATVLAYDLCKAGYQAVDIGHIDLEYEWFKKGEGCRTPVEGKYNNELEGGNAPKGIEDEEYREQVIADFSIGQSK